MLRALTALFLDEYPQQIVAIQTAIRSGDVARLKTETSGLKGSLSNFWAADAYALANILESITSIGTIDGAAKVAADLEVALENLRPDNREPSCWMKQAFPAATRTLGSARRSQ
jgi:hypothetical protein